jgi:hypothetical protein
MMRESIGKNRLSNQVVQKMGFAGVGGRVDVDDLWSG